MDFDNKPSGQTKQAPKVEEVNFLD